MRSAAYFWNAEIEEGASSCNLMISPETHQLSGRVPLGCEDDDGASAIPKPTSC